MFGLRVIKNIKAKDFFDRNPFSGIDRNDDFVEYEMFVFYDFTS